MRTVAEKIADARGRIADIMLLASTVLGFPALLASLYRIPQVGFRTIMVIHLVAYLAILAMAGLRGRIQIEARATTLAVIPLLIGIGGMLEWGLNGLGPLWLLVGSIIATVLLGPRVGVIALGGSVLYVLCIGALVVTGHLGFDFDANTYGELPMPWVNVATSMIVAGALLVGSIHRLHQEIRDTAEDLRLKNEELVSTNRRLEREVREKNRHQEKERELERRLHWALTKVLHGYIPICSSCRSIRVDDQRWMPVEQYVQQRTDSQYANTTYCDTCRSRVLSDLGL